MSYYASNEYLGPINKYTKPVDTLDLIKNGLRVDGEEIIPKPNKGEKQIVLFESKRHAMLLIREDDKLYFFRS